MILPPCPVCSCKEVFVQLSVSGRAVMYFTEEGLPEFIDFDPDTTMKYTFGTIVYCRQCNRNRSKELVLNKTNRLIQVKGV